MKGTTPHFLLLSEAGDGVAVRRGPNAAARQRWRFVLEATDGSALIEAEDDEPEDDPERLELLALVRGLEALDQPSRVTLVTSSLYVSQGLRFGLEEWRENAWQWEKFGELVPIKNGDLWRRVDQALRFHQVDCRIWRIDRAHPETTPRYSDQRDGGEPASGGVSERRHSSAPVAAPHFAARRRVEGEEELDVEEVDDWYERHPELEAALPRSTRRRRPSPLARRRGATRPHDGPGPRSTATHSTAPIERWLARATRWLQRLKRRWASDRSS